MTARKGGQFAPGGGRIPGRGEMKGSASADQKNEIASSFKSLPKKFVTGAKLASVSVYESGFRVGEFVNGAGGFAEGDRLTFFFGSEPDQYSENWATVIAHEIAHTYDYRHTEKNNWRGRASDQKEFRDHLNKMKSILGVEQRKYKYYLTKREAWAQVSALVIKPLRSPVSGPFGSGHLKSSYARAAMESGLYRYVRNYYRSLGVL